MEKGEFGVQLKKEGQNEEEENCCGEEIGDWRE